MDRRQFNKIVAASIPAAIGASLLPSVDAKSQPEYTLGAKGVEELVGKRMLKPGEHIFGGLIDGKQPIAAFYYPHQSVYDWLWRINYQYIAVKYLAPNWLDLVWTDHWQYYGTEHKKLSSHGCYGKNATVHMQDNSRNCLFWEPNSHRRNRRIARLPASLYLHEEQRSLKLQKLIGKKAFKGMPYPAHIFGAYSRTDHAIPHISGRVREKYVVQLVESCDGRKWL